MTETNYNQEINSLTKEALQTALIQLLNETSLEKISITKLTKRAGVSRMAYYRNYDSLYEVLTDVLDVIFYDLLNRAKIYLPQGLWHQFWVELLEVVYDERELATLLFNPSGNDYVLHYLNEQLLTIPLSNAERYIRRSFIGSIYNVLVEWIHNDFDLSPQELADVINLISYSNIPLEQVTARSAIDE